MSRQLADKIRVRILRRHIVKGKEGINRGNGITDCIVAQALKEMFPRRAIAVAYTFADVGKTTYRTTATGTRFIERAVDGKRVKPTTITLTKDNG